MTIAPKYTPTAYATRLGILLVDIFFALISFQLAFLLRNNLDFSVLPAVGIGVFIVLAVRIVSFRWFRTYAVVVRYAGVSDIIHTFSVVAGGSLLLFGLAIVLRPYGVLLPLSVIVIDFFLLLVLMIAFRLAMPGLHYLLYGQNKNKKNVIIVGAGSLGSLTRQVIRNDVKSDMNIVAILDDNPAVLNKHVDGVRVYNPSKLDEILDSKKVHSAIFAIKNIDPTRRKEIAESFIERDIKVLKVPFRANWSEGNFNVNELKDIQIEDLLDRSSIVLDKKNVRDFIEGKTVMITGGAGSIGSELVRQLIGLKPAQLIVLDQAETPLVNLDLECKEKFEFKNLVPVIADVTNRSRIEAIFRRYKPAVVFHAAAYKHVPIMESYPYEAISVNVLGTRNIADASEKYRIEKFVMVSTDKAVNPTNVMGASKRAAEIYVQSLSKDSKTQFITTRFGNVLGSNGSVVPRFKKQIAAGGPITVTHPDITRYFMTIPEASQLVLEAGAMGNGGEIFLFDMGESVKILDLAEKMVKLSGLKPYEDIDISFSGLRPGEKLYEELLATKENSIETHHPKITKAKVREYEYTSVCDSIEEIIESLAMSNDMALVKGIKDLVPEYLSKNSKFEQLDTSAESVTV